MNSFALKIRVVVAGAALTGAVSWETWATDTLIEHSVTLERVQTKLDYLIDPNAKAVANVRTDHD